MPEKHEPGFWRAVRRFARGSWCGPCSSRCCWRCSASSRWSARSLAAVLGLPVHGADHRARAHHPPARGARHDPGRAARRPAHPHRRACSGSASAVHLCFLVPGGAILVMPAAVAGRDAPRASRDRRGDLRRRRRETRPSYSSSRPNSGWPCSAGSQRSAGRRLAAQLLDQRRDRLHDRERRLGERRPGRCTCPSTRDRSTGSPKITSIGLRGKRLIRFDQRGSTRCAPQVRHRDHRHVVVEREPRGTVLSAHRPQVGIPCQRALGVDDQRELVLRRAGRPRRAGRCRRRRARPGSARSRASPPRASGTLNRDRLGQEARDAPVLPDRVRRRPADRSRCSGWAS